MNKTKTSSQHRLANLKSFPRRQRTTFNNHQLARLHELFRTNQYPEPVVRDHLAKEIGLESERVQVWFQNQRAKDKKRRGSYGENDLEQQHQYQVITHQQQQQQQQPQAQYDQSYPQDLPYQMPSCEPNYTHNEDQHSIAQDCEVHSSPQMLHTQVQSRSQPLQALQTRQTEPQQPETQEHTHQQARTRNLFVFTTELANEAAQAVKDGRVKDIIEYHLLVRRLVS